MTVEDIRRSFPQLDEKVYGKSLVYLDNAATSLRPVQVINKWVELSSKYNANLHRAVHYMANVATEEYESTRDAVKDFLNAASREEIVFTSGATASLNLLASTLGESCFKAGDEILISEAEHHSDIVPWQFLRERKGIGIKVLPVDDKGELRMDILGSLITERTKLCCVTHVSNVLGIVNPIEKIAAECHKKGCALLVDGAQGVVHSKVDVQKLGCDFYVFSGHKMYAAPGTGVLYARKPWLDTLPPYMGGGEMIQTVTWEKTDYAPAPQKFEAGTQNMAGVPTLKEAIKIMADMGEGECAAVRDYLLDAFAADPTIHLYGEPAHKENKIPLFSFTMDGVHHEDLALILDKMGIAVRSGQMCAEPLMDRYGVTGMLRASFAPYNTLEEAEYFIKSLHKAAEMLR